MKKINHHILCFVFLLIIASVGFADEPSEEPPMREITSDEVTRFLAQPDSAKIDGY